MIGGLEVMLRQAGPIPLDIAFSCRPGELLALVGASGSGKSTILRAIAGLYRARTARVAVDGEVWEDTAAGTHRATPRRRVGLVFQSYALFPSMTAAGNIAAALDHVPAAERAARARALLDLVNLGGLEHRRPAELSGGQQQRVAVARALAREPKALLLDEPFSAVDKTTRGRLYRELAVMRQRLAMPIVLVTHDLDEALMLADTMCLIQRGAFVQHGPPLDVIERPASVEAARLVGQRNVFPGRVRAHLGDPPRTLIDWRGGELVARHQPGWPVGSDIAWLIPPAKVMLHRRDRPSRGEVENPVKGRIKEFVPLGDTRLCAIALEGGERRRLSLQVPRHVADRNALAAGAEVGLSLIADAIHIMPAGVPGRPRT